MAIKKNAFQNYTQATENAELNNALESKKKYSQNRVFDTPKFLDETTANKQEGTEKKATSKLSTNGEQTVNKVPSQPTTNGKQSVDKRYSNGKQTVNKVPSQPTTNGKQSVDNISTELPNKFTKLQGLQRNLMIVFFQSCKLTGSRITQEIGLNYLASVINGNKKSIKTSILRLKKKGCILLAEYKDGRGGWSKYEIEEDLYQQIADSDKHSLNLSISPKTVNNNSVYSSSNINTTTKNNKLNLPEEWQLIDFEDLISINFSKTQLKQLVDKNEPELVQESIYHFAYGLENNPKIKQYVIDNKALNVLMGVLRKGQGWTESGYVSPQERALKEKLERRKAEKARIEQMEKELFDIEYADWFEKQDKEWLEKLIEPGTRLEGARVATWRTYFKKNIWGKLKEVLEN